MICHLCLKEKPLIGKSHIIPEFMYKHLLGDDGFYHKLDKRTYDKFTKRGKTPKQFQSGEYDSNIFCGDCENEILNKKYEDYAAKVYEVLDDELQTFGNLKVTKYASYENTTFRLIENIDYTRFKLFLLSILWRSSISNREFFKKVKLGYKHDANIRKMLFECNPGEHNDYPCLIVSVKNEIEILKGFIERPRKISRDGNTSYIFMISGILYEFFVSKHNLPDFALNGVIDNSNKMVIWDLPPNHSEYYFTKFREHYLSDLSD